MNTVIDNHTAGLDSKSDNQLEWELIKVKIKDFTRNYSKQKSIHNRTTQAELYGKLNSLSPKLQALVYDILPSTTAVFSYAIGSRKLSANEQFFVGAQTVIAIVCYKQLK